MVDFEKQLEKFLKFYDRIKGRKDVKSRVAVLANPDNPKAMSILTVGQAEFVAHAYYLSGVTEWGGIFEGLRELADEIMGVSPSKHGVGRTETIQLVGAMSETQTLKKLGFTIGKEAGEAKSD